MNNGDAPHDRTATVELLTAEVRVLQVGSRQVTLSVARQLDLVPLDALEPFGRVRTRDYDYAVIGKHVLTGALVMARYDPAPWSSRVSPRRPS